MLFSCELSFGQNGPNNEMVVTSVKNSDSNNLLRYLFGNYGIEKTETIVKNIAHFEKENDVKVVTKEDYIVIIPQIEAKIAASNDPVEKQILAEKKSKFVLITHIESQVN